MKLLLLTGVSDMAEAHQIAGVARAGVKADLVADAESPHLGLWKECPLGLIAMRFRGKFDLPAALRLRRILRHGGYDAFHAFANRPLTNVMLASVGFKMGRIAYCGTTHHLKRLDPASRVTFLSRRLDRVACVSEAVRRYLLSRGIPADRLRVVPKGHDPSWYRAWSRARLCELGISADAFAIACVANLRPVKGGATLLQAVRLLPPASSVRVLLIGRIEDAALKRQIEEDPVLRLRVVAVGFRPDAVALLGACDASVMPSLRNEGLPKAVIESMCLGVPPIVSDAGGLPELVESGRHGWVTPAGDAAALAQAMDTAAADRRVCVALGRAARARIETDFHIRRTIDKTLEMYRDLERERAGSFVLAAAPRG